MFSILLLILKIIGITVLVILGLVILLVALILFAPIRYQLFGSYLSKEPKLSGKITWFIPGLSAKVFFDQKLTYYVRWFGHYFVSSDSSKIKEKKSKEKKSDRKKKKENAREDFFENQNEEVTDDFLERQEGISSEDFSENLKENLQDAPQEVADENLKEDFLENQCKGFFQRIADKVRKFFQTIVSLVQKVKQILTHIASILSGVYGKIDSVKKRITYYYDLWQKDATQKVWEDCKGRLAKLLKHLKPKRFTIDIKMGYEDPATTGMIMGIWGMLYPIIGGTIRICPVFDEKVMDAELKLRGKIRLIHVLIAFLQFSRDKRLKKLLELVKKGGK